MSLVICSNQEKDGEALRQNQSVYNAWSFRNPLSSTMTIPANAQVALQSCKVNVDGRVAFTNNNSKFYHYFGQKLSLDGEAPDQENSTSQPVVAKLTSEDQANDVIELSSEQFANTIQTQIRSTSFHPNTKDQAEVEVLRNASSRDFLGYKFSFKQNASNTNTLPTSFRRFYSEYRDLNASYSSGVFQRNALQVNQPSIGISIDNPFSLTNGSFIVNLSGANANVNASGVNWIVGLSRFVRNPQLRTGQFAPEKFDFTANEDLGGISFESCFVDFGVGRNDNDELIVFQSSKEADEIGVSTCLNEIQYWGNSNSSYAGGGRADWTDNASNVEKIGFFSNGEDISVKTYSKGKWSLITEFDSGENASTYFKPVNQCCWCLHPVISIGAEDSNTNSCKLEIEEFSTPTGITGYDPLTPYKGGWFETMELEGTQYLCSEMEERSWNHPESNTRAYKVLNGSGGVAYDAVMILQQTDIYDPSFSANATELFGFNQAIVDTPASGDSTVNTITFESVNIPSLVSSLAMFVRLNNMGQNVTNAFQGNNSKIIAHLPRFDNQNTTGRLYFEPNTPIFLDLDNPAPMQVNEFDISFNYINEQYATILTGQSIVCLLFRKKPKELM